MSLPLLSWYDANRRNLPWRTPGNPYATWVSEIMLQQTTVVTVIPYFLRWMTRFPAVEDLAAASEEEVLSLWQGLGYYRRARSLQAGAKLIVEKGWPVNAAEWESVPGVGRYTAGAIASIALGQPVPLVDGNVERVFARVAGDDSSELELKKRAWEWAEVEMSSDRPGDYNQALMELGATVCTPRAPRCSVCPCSDVCVSFREGKQEERPVVAPKPPVTRLVHHVGVPIFAGQFGIRQIPKGQWWEGMWEFPRFADPEGDRALADFLDGGLWRDCGKFTHAVTTHRITVHVSVWELVERIEELRWVDPVTLGALPLPAPQRRAQRLAFDLLALG